MKLTDAIIRKALPQDKPYRLTDDRGLFLHVATSGTKTWRLRFRKGGKDTAITIGEYPIVGLKAARDAVISILAEGKGLPIARKPIAPTFGNVAEEWMSKKKSGLKETSIKVMRSALKNHILPAIGNMAIDTIEPITVLNVIRAVEATGSISEHSRVFSVISQIMRFAVASQYIPSNPARDISDAIQKVQGGHVYAATDKESAAVVVKAVRSASCAIEIRLAMEFLMLTFVRPDNVLSASWDDIDLEGRAWHIPASNMKMGVAHDVPLSDQAVGVLMKAREFNPDGLVFRSSRCNGKISNRGLNNAMENAGIPSSLSTAHGFRSMASTLLNEAGEDPDVIEKQLAHKSGDSIRAIYNRAAYWEKRVALMQKWADMVDELGK